MPSVMRNFYYSLAGNVLFSVGMWLNISVIAKLSNVEAVGDYALANAIISPLFALFSLNLRAAIVTDVVGQFQYREYFSTRVVMSLLCTVAILVITVFQATTYEFVATMSFLTAAKVAEAFCDIRNALSQKMDDMRTIAVSMGLRGMVGSLSLFVGLLATESLPVGLACLAVTWIAIYHFHDKRISKTKLTKRDIFPKLSSMKSIIGLCLPLGILLLINLSINNIPRYFVSSWLGQKPLGYFAATTYFLFVGGVFINATTSPLTRRFAEHFIGDLKKFKLLIVQATSVALLVGVFGIIVSVYFGSNILTLAYTREYADYSHLLTWSMAASVPLYCSTVLGVAITATRRFRSQMLINLSVPVVALLFLFGMQEGFSLVNGVQAILVAYCTKLVIQGGLITCLMLEKQRALESKGTLL